jgi:hypothetical protein
VGIPEGKREFVKPGLHMGGKHRMAQKSVNLKYSLVLMGMFIFKCASRFVERHHSVVSCALSMEDFISHKFVHSVSNKVVSNVF